MPTERERRGDFSQTFDSQGRLVNIRDPLRPGNCSATTGGPACFPGNVIPLDRIDPVGRALLNLFPQPNATDPTGTNQYNYVFQTAQDWPRDDQVLRIDWNVAPKTTMYGRLQWGYEKRSGGVSLLGSTGGWPQMATKYEIDTVSYVNTLLHTFNPTTFAEFTIGVNWAHQYTSPFDQAALDANDRREGAARPPAVLPAGEPCIPAAAGDVHRRSSGNDRVVRHRAAVSVLRLQHAVQRVGQPHEVEGRAHAEDGAVRRAHDPAGGADVELQR